MFNVGGGELLVILLVALIVLGPQRLPEAARTVGKVVGEIRRLSTGFQREIRDAFEESDTTTRKPAEPAPLAAAVSDVDAAHPDPHIDDPDPVVDEPGATEPPAAAENGAAAGAGRDRGPGAGELAPEVGDAIDQVVAGTPPSPAADAGDDDRPGDARAAS